MEVSYVPPGKDVLVLRVLKGDLRAEQGRGAILFDRQKGLLVRGD